LDSVRLALDPLGTAVRTAVEGETGRANPRCPNLGSANGRRRISAFRVPATFAGLMPLACAATCGSFRSIDRLE